MTTGWTKLENSILASSIWDESPEFCKVWITLLSMSDRNGFVESSISGIAAFSRLPIETVKMAIEKFKQPDPLSKSKKLDGIRLQEVDRGFLLVNYVEIRNKKANANSRDSKREWYYKNREKINEQKRLARSTDDSETARTARTRLERLETARDIAEAEAEAEKSSSVSPNDTEEANVFYTKKVEEAVIPTEDEIVKFGQGPSGIPEDYCRYFHAINTEKNAWTDNGRLIQWTKRLVRYWANARANWGKGTSKTGWKNFERTRTMENDHSKGF